MSKAGFTWFGDEILRGIIATAEDRLLKSALDLKDRSVQEAPVDTGDLRGDCSVNKQGDMVEIGYSLPYAVIQHEALEFRHPEGGKAKYLEDPFNANKDKYLRFIAKGLIR